MRYEIRNSTGIIYETNDIEKARKYLEKSGTYYIQYTKEVIDLINSSMIKYYVVN